eukprot:5211732-Prymnesium_polylepis.1
MAHLHAGSVRGAHAVRGHLLFPSAVCMRAQRVWWPPSWRLWRVDCDSRVGAYRVATLPWPLHLERRLGSRRPHVEAGVLVNVTKGVRWHVRPIRRHATQVEHHRQPRACGTAAVATATVVAAAAAAAAATEVAVVAVAVKPCCPSCVRARGHLWWDREMAGRGARTVGARVHPAFGAEEPVEDHRGGEVAKGAIHRRLPPVARDAVHADLPLVYLLHSLAREREHLLRRRDVVFV